ncbi:MAG: HlyD family secretion protein, partial [Acidobacteria bacterium]|nr:HlyD family secretion protein [Acidobacteriota bacterium]
IGDSAWRGEKIIEIPDLRRMQAEGEVDEADAGRVAVGQRVVFRLDAHPDVIHTARVGSIHSAVQTRSPNDPVKVVGLDLAPESVTLHSGSFRSHGLGRSGDGFIAPPTFIPSHFYNRRLLRVRYRPRVQRFSTRGRQDSAKLES